jgi:hypothetical protein
MVGNYVPLHIVLGPDKHQPDVVRLEAMIRYAMRDRFEHRQGPDHPSNYEKWYNLVVQPLWAEDFLSVANGGILTQPYYSRDAPMR